MFNWLVSLAYERIPDYETCIETCWSYKNKFFVRLLVKCNRNFLSISGSV